MDKMTNLHEVQEALYSEYGNKYPWSASVGSGLEQLVKGRYAGSWDSFVGEFVLPTLQLLSTLKQKRFPLVLDGRVIVHLTAPTQRLESGEMFFQVGHTSAGTLALKFTKYKGSDVVMQPSTVEEADYHVAFTLAYIEGLRGEATLGDQLMRVLLVSAPTEQGLLEIQKVEAKRILQSHNGTGSACENTEATKYISLGVCEEFNSIPRQEAIIDSTSEKENSPYPTANLAVKDFSVKEEGSQEAVVAATDASAIIPSIRGTSTKNEESEPQVENAKYPLTTKAIGDNPPSLVENPSYLPMQSVIDETLHGNQGKEVISNPNQDYSTQKTCADSRYSGAQSSSGECENFAYPTAHDAVCENRSSVASNPPYPLVYDAVKNTDHDNQQKDEFSKNCKSSIISFSMSREEIQDSATCVVENPGYPSIYDAVKNTDQDSQLKNAYSKDCKSPVSSKPHEEVQDSATCVVENPGYPMIQSAVEDEDHEERREVLDTAITKMTHPTDRSFGNPSYPLAREAVQDIASAAANNPPYPLVQSAVTNSEKYVQEVASKRSENPSYPTAPEAVQDTLSTKVIDPAYPLIQSAVDASKQKLQGKSAGSGSFENPPYPTVTEALHESAVENSRQATIKQGEVGGIPNASYPTIQDACENKEIDTPGATKNVLSTKPHNRYPADFDDAISDVY